MNKQRKKRTPGPAAPVRTWPCHDARHVHLTGTDRERCLRQFEAGGGAVTQPRRGRTQEGARVVSQRGQELKALRLAYGLTQKALGKLVGVEGETISLYERGERTPSVPLLRLATLLLTEERSPEQCEWMRRQLPEEEHWWRLSVKEGAEVDNC